MSDGVFDLLKELKDMGYLVKLDTNGTFPDRLRRAVFGGLADAVAMDIKNSREKYGLTVGIESFDIAPVEESVAFLKTGTVDAEFRTTVVPELHTEADMELIGQWLSGAKKYYLQRFKDSGDLIGGGFTEPRVDLMENLQNIAAKYIEKVELRGI